MPDVITTILRKIHTDSGNKSGGNEQNTKELYIQTPSQQGERPEIALHGCFLTYYPSCFLIYLFCQRNKCVSTVSYEPESELH